MNTATETSRLGVDKRGVAVDELASRIRSAIVKGEFSPNERLVEFDLVAAFKSTRGTVRAALTLLASEGLVERETNRGARVRILSRDEAIEICEVRRVVEGLCAAKAAERITQEQSDDLLALLQRMEDKVRGGDVVAYLDLNQLLHQRIREISGHSTAGAIIERLRNQSTRLQLRLTLVPGRPEQSIPEHRAIVESIISGDAVRAEELTREHLAKAIEALTSIEAREIR